MTKRVVLLLLLTSALTACAAKPEFQTTINGLVYDVETLEPMSGVSVALVRLEPGERFFQMGTYVPMATTRTDDSGRFEFVFYVSEDDSLGVRSSNDETVFGGGSLYFSGEEILSGRVELPMEIAHKRSRRQAEQR